MKGIKLKVWKETKRFLSMALCAALIGGTLGGAAVPVVEAQAAAAPIIAEDFEDGTAKGYIRGDATHAVVDEGRDGGKAVKISARGANWHTYAYDVSAYSGAEAKIQAYMKTADANAVCEITGKVGDADPYYNWLINTNTSSADEWVLLEGTVEIPEGAKELYFSTGGGTADYLLDDINIQFSGDNVSSEIEQTFNFAELEKFNNAEGELTYEENAEAGTTTVNYGGQYKSLFVKIPSTVDVKNLKEVRFENERPGDIGYKLYTNAKFETDKHNGDAAVSYGNPVVSASGVQDKADLGYVVVMSMVAEEYTVVFNKVTFVTSTAKPKTNEYAVEDLTNTVDDGVTVEEKDGKMVIEYPAIYKSVYFALPRNVNGKTLEKVSFDVESVETVTVSNNSVSDNNVGSLAFKVLTDVKKADKPLAVEYGKNEVAVPSTTDPVTHVAVMSNDGKQAEGQKLRVVLKGFSFTFMPEGNEDRYIEDDVESLYKVVQKDSGVSMGVAVPVGALNDPERMKLVYKHYNSMTCENEMKPESILGSAEPGVSKIEDVKLNFANADAMMDAVVSANSAGIANLKVRGHVFVWHSQTPTWFFREGLKSDGAYVTPEEMNKRMEWYIKSVAQHFDTKYPGLIYAWDVVNEAANDGGGPRTNGDWYGVYQSWDFIPKAFEYADKYLAKDTILFYNDYNECTPTKCDQIVEFLKEIRKHISKDRTLGAGMQGHHDMATPTLEMIEAATRAYAANADVVHITELDIKSTMGYVDSPEARVVEYTQQGHRYKEIYNMIKRVNAETGNKVTNITIWGTDDKNSWLKTSNSVGGSADGKTPQFPLLFDEDLKVKPAYWAFVDQNKLEPAINAVNAMNTDDAKYASENIAKKADGTAWYTFKTYWADGKLYFWVDDTVAKKDVKLYTDVNADGKPEGPVAFKDGVASVDVKDISVKQTYLFDIVVDGKAYNDTKGSFAETSKYFAKVTTKPLMKLAKGTAYVDGNVADWKDVPAVELTEKMDKPEATVEAKVCWDEEKLYVLMDVKDANLDATSGQVHEKDSMELFIDELNEKAGGYDNNDKQYRVNYLNEQSFNGATCTAANIESAVEITDDGYVVEAAIKWTALDAKPGELIGLDLQINDGKGGTRVGTRNWYDTSGNGWQNPGVFGTAVLVDADETSEADAAKAKAADDAVKAIGTVKYDATSKAKIDAAVAAYADMTVAQRLLVAKDTFKTLSAAQTSYEKLEEEAKAAEEEGKKTDAAAVKNVTDKIKAIGAVKYDTASKAKIDEARKAYDALTPAQKAQIPADVLKVLTSAEATYKTAEAEATKVEYFAKFSVKSVPIKKGQSSTALAKDIQIAKGDKVVKWTTSDKKVVTVNAKTGKIKGKKVGKATITATTQSGKTAEITVKVQKKAVAAKAVTLTNKATGKAIQAKKTVTLKKGKKLTVVANVKPMTCVQKVKFTSSNKKVVSVTSKGVIKAKKKGKATITAKVGKKTFKFTVKVK